MVRVHLAKGVEAVRWRRSRSAYVRHKAARISGSSRCVPELLMAALISSGHFEGLLVQVRPAYDQGGSNDQGRRGSVFGGGRLFARTLSTRGP